jgi:hypothetical protein
MAAILTLEGIQAVTQQHAGHDDANELIKQRETILAKVPPVEARFITQPEQL